MSRRSFRCSLLLTVMVAMACASTCLGDDAATAPATEPATAPATEPTTAPTTEPATQVHQWFDPSRTGRLVMCAALCGSVLVCIGWARSGRPIWVRKIAALQAVDEAVGRATEMGRPCLFIPGIQDMDDMGTIA